MTARKQDQAAYLADLKATIHEAVAEALRAEGVTRDTRPMLNTEQVAERLGISPRSVCTMLDKRILPSIRVGPAKWSRVVEASVLEAYIQSRRDEEAVGQDA